MFPSLSLYILHRTLFYKVEQYLDCPLDGKQLHEETDNEKDFIEL